MDANEIKNQLAELQSKIDETKKQTTEQRIENLEKELNQMKDRYIMLLEHTLQVKGNQKLEASDSASKRSSDVQLDKFQLLVLLKESRATSVEFAVSATQLQKSFSLNRTTRTIRDKLAVLELMNLVNSIGQKPKNYFLTPKGLSILSQQQRGLMNIH